MASLQRLDKKIMKLIFVLVVCLGIWNANGLQTEEEKSPQTALDQDSDFHDVRSLYFRSGEIYYRAEGGLSYSDREKMEDIAWDGLRMYGTDANAMRKHFIKRMRNDYGSHKSTGKETGETHLYALFPSQLLSLVCKSLRTQVSGKAETNSRN